MTSMKATDRCGNGVVSTPLVELYMRLCEERGMSRCELLMASGVSERELNPSGGWVAQSVLEKLFYARLEREPDPILGMHLATALDPSRASLGLLGFLCLSCPSIQDFHYTLAHFGRLISNIFSTDLVHEPGAVLWGVDLLYTEELLIRDNSEWFLAACAQLIHRMDSNALKEVHLKHPPLLVRGKPHRQYEKAFPCPVRFQQAKSSLVIDPKALSRPSATGDAVVFETLRKQAELLLDHVTPEQHIVDRVKQEIRQLLAGGKVSRTEVCRRIGVSSRHLHRQLGQYNSSYQILLDEVRSINAIKLLVNEAACLSEISTELGFSSVKSFSRWFQGHFGEPPGIYRRHELPC